MKPGHFLISEGSSHGGCPVAVRDPPASLDDPDPTAELALHKNEGAAGVVQNGLNDESFDFQTAHG